MAGVLGVIILALHGDRKEFFQDPYTYKTSHTTLTPLGQTQEVQLGSFLRSQYLTPSSPFQIRGISGDLASDRQLLVRADNGGESGVIIESAQALLQGLFPPTPRSNAKLANGTVVVGPFGGYQYIPIESVEPIQSIDLEAWTECPAFFGHIKKFYESPAFKKKAQEASFFLKDLQPYLYGRPATLENMWNVYDFLNVNYIHNETFAFHLPPSYLAQARALANWHEHGVFTDKDTDGIGNIAGRTMLPSIIAGMERIADTRDPLSLVVEEVSYKPIISVLNVTGIDEKYPDLRGIPNYASALVFELRRNEEGETLVRTKFKNGTTDPAFRTLHLFGHKDDVALNEFVYRMSLAAVDGTQAWCKTCKQSSARGCAMCANDFMRHLPVPAVAKIESGIKSCLPTLDSINLNMQYLACFALFFFVMSAGFFKVMRSRRPRLSGYDQLSANVRYTDDAPAVRGQSHKQGY